MMDFSAYNNDALGPVQHDEAVFLYGLALTLRPPVVLEFGVLNGHSTRIWLEAGCDVIGVDIAISDKAKALQREYPDQLTLIKGSMHTARIPDYSSVELVFWDAGHDFDISMLTFDALPDHVKNNALHVIHDTGAWYRHNAPDHALEWFKEGENMHYHRPEERRFCDWLQGEGLQRIDLGTPHTFRHGITLMKKQL